jgi:hypothetical protein
MSSKGKQITKFKYTYKTIADIVELKPRTVWGHGRQGIFDPTNLDSVVQYINNRRLINANNKRV